MGQTYATMRFLHKGRHDFTRTGWERAQKKYESPDILESASMAGKVVVITGANAGIGRTVAQFAADKDATVYMVCRNEQRGETARKEIVESSKNEKVHVVVGDTSLKASVLNAVKEIRTHTSRIDALVCNAGALLNERTVTSEGKEVTFACHYLYGCKLLTDLCVPLLKESTEPRVLVVASGGLYLTKVPSWDVLTGQEGAKYDGQLNYSYAKRLQLVQCERWAKDESFQPIKTVTVHPGWTATDGVDAAFGKWKFLFKPLRNKWQGTEGICWLLVAPFQGIQSGEFYLDRSPQEKHIVSRTKNTEEELAEVFKRIDEEDMPGWVDVQ